MKVMQVIPSFGMGGAEKVVLNYLRSSKKLGIDMQAVSLYPPTGSAYDRTIKKEGLDVVYLKKKKGYDLSVIHGIDREIMKYCPDIIHTHLHSLKYVLLSKSAKQKKLFHTIHNPPKKDTTILDRTIHGICYHTGRVTPIALHEGLADEVNAYYRIGHTKIIYNAICLDDYKSSVGKSEIRMALGIPRGNFVVGHVGSFKKQKNHAFLIEIFYRLQKREPNATLLLVGDGALRKQIEKLVKSKGLAQNVLFLGNRADVANLMRAMDVFVLPSFYEGLGIVAVEAQIAGLRCVVSDAVPPSVVVSDYVNQLSLDDTADDWADKILAGGDYMDRVCDINMYHSDHVVDRLMKLYKGEVN